MEREAIESEVRRLIIEARGREASGSDGPTAGLLPDDIDSLEGVEAILAVEERFGVTIPDDELSGICRSIPRIVDAVVRQLAPRGERGETAHD